MVLVVWPRRHLGLVELVAVDHRGSVGTLAHRRPRAQPSSPALLVQDGPGGEAPVGDVLGHRPPVPPAAHARRSARSQVADSADTRAMASATTASRLHGVATRWRSALSSGRGSKPATRARSVHSARRTSAWSKDRPLQSIARCRTVAPPWQQEPASSHRWRRSRRRQLMVAVWCARGRVAAR